MTKTRNSELLASFVAYCEAHPDQRFWQALRNWCGWGFVVVFNVFAPEEHEEGTDTFYWEGKDGS